MKDLTTDDLEEHYISENVSALGGSTGDADAVGALRDDESERYEQAASERSEMRDADDMRPDSSIPAIKGDAKMFAFVTGWHPFMRFFYRVSQMLYRQYNPEDRPYELARRHRRMFWFCWWADNAVIGLGVTAIFIMLGITAYKAFF